MAQQNLSSWRQCLYSKTFLAGISSCHWRPVARFWGGTVPCCVFLCRIHLLKKKVYPIFTSQSSLIFLQYGNHFCLMSTEARWPIRDGIKPVPCLSLSYPSPEEEKKDICSLRHSHHFLSCPSLLSPSPEKGVSDLCVTVIISCCGTGIKLLTSTVYENDMYIPSFKTKWLERSRQSTHHFAVIIVIGHGLLFLVVVVVGGGGGGIRCLTSCLWQYLFSLHTHIQKTSISTVIIGSGRFLGCVCGRISCHCTRSKTAALAL